MFSKSGANFKGLIGALKNPRHMMYVSRKLPAGYTLVTSTVVALKWTDAQIGILARFEGWQQRRTDLTIMVAHYIIRNAEITRQKMKDTETNFTTNFKNADIANYLNISERTVRRILRTLEELGIIVKVHEGHSKEFMKNPNRNFIAIYALIISKVELTNYLKKSGYYSFEPYGGEIVRPNRIYDSMNIKNPYTSESEEPDETAEISGIDKELELAVEESKKSNLQKMKEHDREVCKCLLPNTEPRFACKKHGWVSGRNCNPASGKWARWREQKRNNVPYRELSAIDQQGWVVLRLKDEFNIHLFGGKFKYLSAEHIRSIFKKFLVAGYNYSECLEAVTSKPDGSKWTYSAETVKNPAGILGYRLKFWTDDDGKPIETRLQKAARLRKLREEKERQKLRAEVAQLGWLDNHEPCPHYGYSVNPRTGAEHKITQPECHICRTQRERGLGVIV